MFQYESSYFNYAYLKIFNVTKEDQGHYLCESSNGNLHNAWFDLKVYGTYPKSYDILVDTGFPLKTFFLKKTMRVFCF